MQTWGSLSPFLKRVVALCRKLMGYGLKIALVVHHLGVGARGGGGGLPPYPLPETGAVEHCLVDAKNLMTG